MKIELKLLFFISFLGLFSCNQKHTGNTLPYYNTPDFSPVWISGNSDSTQRMHQIAGFIFTDQDGKIISEKQLDNKITLANFFFTSCGSICPKMTHNLMTIQDSLAMNKDVQLFSFSVMPWKDSVSVLKAYEKENGLRASIWRLITGKKSATYALARQSFFAEMEAGYDADSTEFLHTEHIILVDKHRHIRGIYNGTAIEEMKHILQDLRVLEKED